MSSDFESDLVFELIIPNHANFVKVALNGHQQEKTIDVGVLTEKQAEHFSKAIASSFVKHVRARRANLNE